MRIVGALDLHRRQITFRWEDTETGEVKRGRIMPASRDAVREWLGCFAALDAHFALEGTTGWRYVVEEMQAAGVTPHLADPAEIHERRSPKRRAKTDRADCEHMSKLLAAGELPESWIPPQHILETRTKVRLRKSLMEQRTQWCQRIQAQLFHQGVPAGMTLRTREGRERMRVAAVSPAGRQLIDVGLAMIDELGDTFGPSTRSWCRSPGARSAVARSLRRSTGSGP